MMVNPTSTSGGPPPVGIGPFESAREACRALQAQARGPEAPPGILSDTERVHALVQALWGAGVRLGSYDRGAVAWLAGLDDSTVAVVVGWISRAGTAAKAAVTLDAALAGVVRRGLAEAAMAREARAAAPCEGCDCSPAGVCDAHAEDLDAAEQFRAAGRDLAGGAR